MPIDPAFDHTVSRDEATQLVIAHQSLALPGDLLSTTFNRRAFEQLLGQAGCVGLRVYQARHGDGSPTLVVVGVDAEGEDLAQAEAVFVQNGTNCPPFCTPSGWF